MSAPLRQAEVLRALRLIGENCRSPGRVLISGGTSAVIEGWRDATIDIDLSYIEEPGGFFEALALAKRECDISVDLLSPTAFIPRLPGSESRHRVFATFGPVIFAHHDFYEQALSKLARGHVRDWADIEAMQRRGEVERPLLQSYFDAVRDELIRFPAIDIAELSDAVIRFADNNPPKP